MDNKITHKPTVLVVDDDEDMLLMMQYRLLAEGYIPLLSPNGYNVMDIISQRHPDIVLMDIHMQGISGGDICHQIKSNPEIASIPIVMFSANDNIEAVSKECGADAFMTKPFTSESFKSVFKNLRTIN